MNASVNRDSSQRSIPEARTPPAMGAKPRKPRRLQGRQMALDPFFLVTLFLLGLCFLAQALLLVWMDLF